MPAEAAQRIAELVASRHAATLKEIEVAGGADGWRVRRLVKSAVAAPPAHGLELRGAQLVSGGNGALGQREPALSEGRVGADDHGRCRAELATAAPEHVISGWAPIRGLGVRRFGDWRIRGLGDSGIRRSGDSGMRDVGRDPFIV